MSTETVALKSWQYGFAMDHLLAIEAVYADYNQWSVSPFSAVKKHTIAQLLHEQRLRVVYRGEQPVGAFALTTAKVASPITIYNDVELARKAPGDLTLSSIAGDRAKLAPVIADAVAHAATWAYVWADDRETQRLLDRMGFRRCGSKVSTFAEIVFVYFKDGPQAYAEDLFGNMAGARGVHGIPPSEFVGIKRIGHVGSATLAPTLATLDRLGIAFTNHYSKYNSGDSWSAVSLRGFSADPAFIIKPIEMNPKWKDEHRDDVFAIQDTPLRREFPELDAMLQPYGDVFERIRLMKLAPGGGELERHTDQVDHETGVKIGHNARIHIPLVTNDQVEFTSWDLDNQPQVVNMRVGEVWYLDTRKPHRAINGGTSDRIHLVVDVIVTKRFVDLLSA